MSRKSYFERKLDEFEEATRDHAFIGAQEHPEIKAEIEKEFKRTKKKVLDTYNKLKYHPPHGVNNGSVLKSDATREL